MLKGKNGLHSLGVAQQKYLLYLAENGAHNSNSLAKALTSNEKEYDQGNVYRALKKLEKSGLLASVDETEYRGRSFDEYWLTSEGAKAALYFGVNVEAMKNKAKEYYQGEKLTKFNAQADLIMFGKESLDVISSIGKLSNEEMREVSAKALEAFPRYLEKYPHIDEHFDSNPLGESLKNLILEMGKELKKEG